VAAVLLGTGCTAASAPTAPPSTAPSSAPSSGDAGAFTAGARGIGDPYFPLDGNGGFDVRHYELDLDYDAGTGAIEGSATLSATATQNLSAFDLDFDDLEVDGVTVDGDPAEWSLETTPISALTGQPDAAGSDDPLTTPGRTELTITPAAGIAEGAEFTVEVIYSGVPELIEDEFGQAGVFRDDRDGGMLVAGQPRVAATWFPVNDHPSDKATFSVRMAVPQGLTMVSNGRLVEQTTEGASPEGDSTAGARTVWHWAAESPMAPYLVTATVGRFELTTFSADGVDYWNAIDPALFEQGVPGSAESYGQVARRMFEAQPEIVSFLSGVFGPYPFAEAGGIADDVPELEFALENQTRPIYPVWAWEDPDDLGLLVHEYAHQWYGDSVSIKRWSDIWLNESFATYAEWLWSEHTGGPGPAEQVERLMALPADDEFWQAEVADPGPTGIFDDAVYQRGAMTLDALRTEVGDDAFFELARSWASANAGGTVGTADFVSFAEQSTGQDLDDLFERFVFSTGRP
jgi:aminopeptidase N